jgi:hypothetical protein
MSDNLIISTPFLNRIVAEALAGQDLRLGIIAEGNQTTIVYEDFTLSNFTSREIAATAITGGTRPTLVLPSNGNYNWNSRRHETPTPVEYSFSATGAPLQIRQLFVIVGGTTAMGNSTGEILAATKPFSGPIVYPVGLPIQIPLNLFFQSSLLP